MLNAYPDGGVEEPIDVWVRNRKAADGGPDSVLVTGSGAPVFYPNVFLTSRRRAIGLAASTQEGSIGHRYTPYARCDRIDAHTFVTGLDCRRPGEADHPRDRTIRDMPQRFEPADWPAPLRVLVLAPHPDDFDAIGVTLRWLAAQGHALHLAVLTTGSGGVDDGFQGAHDAAAKAALREREQSASCRFFGLPEGRCHFLRLWQDPKREAEDAARLRDLVRTVQPQRVFMPHGNDSNATHRRCFQAFDALARAERLTLQACLNQDAKTQGLRADLAMPFGEADAVWKAELLRHHESQQQRNLRTRGHGFDERVLQLNREAAAGLGLAEPYAEVFERTCYVDGNVSVQAQRCLQAT